MDPFLLQINASIKSDLSELLSRYTKKEIENEVNYTSVNNKVNTNTDYLNSNIEKFSTNKGNDFNSNHSDAKNFVYQEQLNDESSFDSLLGSVSC